MIRLRVPAVMIGITLVTAGCAGSVSAPGGESVEADVVVVDPQPTGDTAETGEAADADEAAETDEAVDTDEAAESGQGGEGGATSADGVAPAIGTAGAEPSPTIATDEEAGRWAAATMVAEIELVEGMLNDEGVEDRALAYLAWRDPLIFGGDPAATWPDAVACADTRLDREAFDGFNPDGGHVSLQARAEAEEVVPIGEGLWVVWVIVSYDLVMSGVNEGSAPRQAFYLVSERGTVLKSIDGREVQECLGFGAVTDTGEQLIVEYRDLMAENS